MLGFCELRISEDIFWNHFPIELQIDAIARESKYFTFSGCFIVTVESDRAKQILNPVLHRPYILNFLDRLREFITIKIDDV